MINEQQFHRRSLLVLSLVGIFVISVLCVSIPLLVLQTKTEDAYFGRKNILLIVVDDLRPALGCYGDEMAITPNIDKLASRGALFKSAYIQEALGAPSRTSLLTSRRPDSLRVYDSKTYWRAVVGDFVTLPQQFKLHGYETISVGKIFPFGATSNFTDDYPYSWSQPPKHSSNFSNQLNFRSDDEDYHFNLIYPLDLNSSKNLPDVEVTDYAISYLKNKSNKIANNVPFFLGVGYYKPHIPFQIPKEYLDLYPIESMKLAPNQNIKPDLLSLSWNPWSDLRESDDIKALNLTFPYGVLPNDTQLLIRQAYYASVSYVDDQIGKLLKALEDAEFAEHTTVVLVGDNGWSLGEHQAWSKYSNFEVSLKVPLIVYMPELMQDKDKRTPFVPNKVLKHAQRPRKPLAPKYTVKDLVELVDIFPTLTEIANIPVPPLCRVYSTAFCTEGLSFYYLMEQIVQNPLSGVTWKTAAFSQYPRPSVIPQLNSDSPDTKDIRYMGYSIRTMRFRYTEWLGFDVSNFKPDWTDLVHRELYDHEWDPDELDNKVEAGDYVNMAAELSRKIKKGWRHAMPPGFFDGPKYYQKRK